MQRASDNRTSLRGKTQRQKWWAALAPLGVAGLLATGCGSKSAPTPAPCEEKCQDAVALRAVRDMMKVAFNNTFQAQPVGMHDLTTDKFPHGSARVFGTATADGALGVTDVQITYVFTQTAYLKKVTEPDQNYVMGLDGTITQVGKIAVQPSATTALAMRSDSVTLLGTVYDPPINYPPINDAAPGCTLDIFQNGNVVSGTLCGRMTGFTF